MKIRIKIIIIISLIFVAWLGIASSSICIFVDGPQPDWLGSDNGCGPYVTYEIQKYFGILWHSEPSFEKNRNELSQVLDWCNDESSVKYGFYNYSNETHSIDTSACQWKEHVAYPNSDSLCVPYVDKWVTVEDWSNKTHYFDTDSCTWKIDQNYDAVNSKGCPQFCPKDKSDTVDDFDATFGGPGNRHPAFLGWDIPDICTNDMVKFLKKHSNMFDNDVPYTSPLDGSVFEYGIDADDIVQCENELLDNRDNEPSWPRYEN